MIKNNLTVLEVKALLKQPGRHRVSENLYLQVRPAAAGVDRKGNATEHVTASWLFR